MDDLAADNSTITTTRGLTLEAPGPRAAVTADEADELLQTWRELMAANPGVPVSCVNLGRRLWHPDVLMRLDEFLQSIASSVTVLMIDDIIASLETSLGLQVLGMMARMFHKAPLETLDLNDNAVGIRGLQELAPLFGQVVVSGDVAGADGGGKNDDVKLQGARALIHVYLRNLGLSGETVDQLVQLLLPIASQLQTIDLSRSQIGIHGARILGTQLLPRCASLVKFVYAGSRPLSEGSLYLSQGFERMVAAATNDRIPLEHLDLTECIFGTGRNEGKFDDGVSALCSALARAPDLKTFIVSDSGFQADGSQLVFDAFTTSGAQLAHLDMSGSEMGPEGVQFVTEWLGVAPQARLETLNLTLNELGDEGLQISVERLAADGGSACPTLHTLILDENELEADGFESLANHRIPSLQHLSLLGNNEEDIDDDILNRIRAMYPVVIITEEDALAHAAAQLQQATAPVVVPAAAQADDAQAVVADDVDGLADVLAGAQI